MIIQVPHRQEWPDEFREIAQPLRRALGDLALRIDHIGSTAVPGLVAKDVIDIQITVRDLQLQVEVSLNRLGYSRLRDILSDHVPPGQPLKAAEWAKWLFRPPQGQRPANLHVRVAGRLNQRYPLLFRDYLRSHPAATEAYARVKSALARLHPNDMDAYYDIKDPVCDIILGAAEAWAASIGWVAGPSDF